MQNPLGVVTTRTGRGVQEPFLPIPHLFFPFLGKAGNLRLFTSVSFPTHKKCLEARKKKYSPSGCFCFALVFIFILTLIAP